MSAYGWISTTSFGQLLLWGQQEEPSGNIDDFPELDLFYLSSLTLISFAAVTCMTKLQKRLL